MTQQKMRGILIRIFLGALFFSEPSYAQETYNEILYLKNGSIIHGAIIELVPDQSLKIKTQNGDVILFRMEEVQKITREESEPVKQRRESVTDDNVKTHGYTTILEFNFVGDARIRYDMYEDPAEVNSMGFVTVNGYMFNPHISTGIGIGIQGFNNFGLLPVFADIRFNVLKGTITPCVSFSAGYSISTDEIVHRKDPRTHGGLFSNLSIGIKFFVKKSQALAFSFGYNYHQISSKFEQFDPIGITSEEWVEYSLENMALKFSFVF